MEQLTPQIPDKPQPEQIFSRQRVRRMLQVQSRQEITKQFGFRSRSGGPEYDINFRRKNRRRAARSMAKRWWKQLCEQATEKGMQLTQLTEGHIKMFQANARIKDAEARAEAEEKAEAASAGTSS